MLKPSSLDIHVVTNDDRPIFKQIVDAIRMQIAQGKLDIGDKLPSVRGLAMQLTINVNTVAKAYSTLTTQGVLQSRPGLGLFVATPRQMLSDRERHVRLQKAVDALVNDVAYLEFSKVEVLSLVSTELAKIDRCVDDGGRLANRDTGT